MSIPVVTVGDSHDDLVGGLERLHGPVSVVRRCSELAELLAACQSGLARAAVVAAGSEELTASLVDRLSAVGVVVIALTDNPEEIVRLRTIGVAAEARAVDAAALAARISAAVAQLSGTGEGPGPAAGDGAASVAAAGQVPRSSGAQPVTASPGAKGRIIAVWGPAGAPGRTLVAANIAGELAAEGHSVLLVDADSYGASVAALLGLLDADALLRIATTVPTKAGSLRVLTGITRADRWTELRAAALTLVLERAREIADVTVVDTGFCLEADDELGFDSGAPRRNAATLRSLELADTVFAVGAADSIGVPRLVRGLSELRTAVPQAAPQVVLNKVRTSAVGRSPERQLRAAWERYGPSAPLTAFLPSDPAASDAALLAGALLLECAPESELRHAIAILVCAPAQRNKKSFVFYSTARRRAKG